MSRFPSISSNLSSSSSRWVGNEPFQPTPDGNRNPSLRRIRYKTEMCRNFKERSRCIYGEQCQFAHGRTDLRDVVRNTKYKTKLCQKYWISGYCAYGPRCNFLHDEGDAKDLAVAEEAKRSAGSASPLSLSSSSEEPKNEDPATLWPPPK